MTQNKYGLVLEYFNELTTTQYAIERVYGSNHPLLANPDNGRLTIPDLIEFTDDDYQPLDYAWREDEAVIIYDALQRLAESEDSWFASNAAFAIGSLVTRQQLQYA